MTSGLKLTLRRLAHLALARRVETAIYHVTAKHQCHQARELVENCPEHLNPHEAIDVAFMAMPAEHWQQYLRYDTAISRDFFKTLDALQKLQRTRQNRKQAVGQAVSPAQSELKTMHAGRSYAFAELSGNGTGSVSQNSPAAPETNDQAEVAANAAPEKHVAQTRLSQPEQHRTPGGAPNYADPATPAFAAPGFLGFPPPKQTGCYHG